MSTSVAALNNSIQPNSQVELFFHTLYGSHMRCYPKRWSYQAEGSKESKRDTNRQWAFLGSKDRMKSVATQATLYAILADSNVDTTYYTPNGYYRRDLRLTETLRWLNAFVFDLDVQAESIQDIFDRIDRVGLPSPTAVIETPSGGYHVTYMFQSPVRATPRAVRLYTAIMGHIAGDLGADSAAVGANRIFRTPAESNLIYFDPANRYDFDLFKNWREINHPFDQTSAGFFNLQTGDLMNHPALQRLLTTPCDYGSRDVVAFNLALAMKASDWSKEQAKSALEDWFYSCCTKGAEPGKKPFTKRDATYKADYVFRRATLHAPKAEIIRELTGLPFYYRTRNKWNSAKPRSARERSHLHEWEADLLALLQSEKELCGTQQELATRLNCPLTSFKTVLSKLKAAGRVTVETRRGRGGLTVVRLPESPEIDQPISDNVIDFPIPESVPVVIHPGAMIIYANFRTKRITYIDRIPVADADPEPPDTGPPD